MSNFTPIAFVDTFGLAASLPPRMGLFRPGEEEERVLPIRGFRKDSAPADMDFIYYARTYTKWVELKNMLGLLKRLAETRVGPVEFGCVWLEMLDPQTVMQWLQPQTGAYYEGFWRAHLPIRTNPAARMYSGTDAAHLLPGQLTIVNVRVPHSAINLGEWPRVHLVVDFRRKPGVFKGEPLIGSLVDIQRSSVVQPASEAVLGEVGQLPSEP